MYCVYHNQCKKYEGDIFFGIGFNYLTDVNFIFSVVVNKKIFAFTYRKYYLRTYIYAIKSINFNENIRNNTSSI